MKSSLNFRRNKKVFIALIVVFTIMMGLVFNKSVINKYDDKISITSFDVKRLSGNVANIENEVKSYDKVTYQIKYKLESDDQVDVDNRTAIITATLTDDEIKYANWNLVESDNVVSEIIEGGKKLKITISGLSTNKLYLQNIVLKITGAPNDFEFKPKIEINESTNSSAALLKVSDIKISTSSISGTVKDSETNLGIPNINLAICKNENDVCRIIKQTTTNSNGEYIFGDLANGDYKVSLINNSEYENSESDFITIDSDNKKYDITTINNGKFNAVIKKYVNKIIVNENGNEKVYAYKDLNKVSLSLKDSKNTSMKIVYDIKVKNEGTKSGFVKVIKEQIPENFELSDDSSNNDWIFNNNAYYNKTLANKPLNAKEEKTLSFTINSKNNLSVGSYINLVKSISEEYHIVNYVLNDKVIKQEIVLDGDKINYEQIPEKEGYNILGWFVDGDGKKQWNFNNYVENDMNLYATYEVQKSKVVLKNPLVPYTDKQSVNYGDTVKEPERNNKVEGYNFRCWQIETEDNKTGIVSVDDFDENLCYNFDEPVISDLTLVSVYNIKTYTIIFMNKDTYDGEYHQYLDPVLVEHGKLLPLPEDPSIENYEFSGWYESDDDGATLKETPFDPLSPITEDLVLYSNYANNIIDVTFKVGTLENGVFTQKIDDVIQKVESGKKVIKPSDPVLSGYSFDDWYTSDELNTKYEFDNIVENSITIYGKLDVVKRKVTFLIPTNEDDNDDTTPDGWEKYDEIEVDDGTVIDKPEDPVLPMCTDFTGEWYESDDNGATLNENAYNFSSQVKKDLVLYAGNEKRDVTITYLDNCGEYQTQTIKCGGTPDEIENPKGETGKAFKCWTRVNSKDTCQNDMFEKEEVECENPQKETTDDTVYETVYDDIGNVNITHEPLIWTNDKVVVTMEKTNVTNKNTYKNELINPISSGFSVNNNLNESTLVSDGISGMRSINNYSFSYFELDLTNSESKDLSFTQTIDSNGSGYVYITEDYDEIQSLSNGLIQFTGDTHIVTNKNTDTFEYNFVEGKKYYVAFIHVSEYDEDYSDLYRVKVIDLNSEISPINILQAEEIEANYNPDDYDIMYKLEDETGFKLYDDDNKPEIDVNTTVYAKLVKKTTKEEGYTAEHIIDNIDKVNPQVDIFEQGTTTPYSIKVNIKVTDLNNIEKLSGIKTIVLTKDSEEVTTLSFGQDNQGNKVEETSYTITGLEELTTYKIGGKVIDYAGNETTIDDVDMTTDQNEGPIVARIIGRVGSLFESEDLYEDYSTLYGAITSCGNEIGTCYIQMVENTVEENTIDELQDISIDLNGKKISSDERYTLTNLGNLQIIDNNEESTSGALVNTNYAAIHNLNNLTIGENDDTVSNVRPVINGATYGLEDDGTTGFYDGELKGETLGYTGIISLRPDGYNISTNNEENKQVSTLHMLSGAVAKIERTGESYTTLSGALNDAYNGTYEESVGQHSLLYTMQTTTPENCFEVVEGSNGSVEAVPKYKPLTSGKNEASSFIVIDLRNTTTNKLLKVEADFSNFAEGSYAAVYVDSTPMINWSDITSSKYSSNYYGNYSDRALYYRYYSSYNLNTGRIYLEAGRIYYLNFAISKNYSVDSSFKITNVSLTDVIQDSTSNKVSSLYGSDLMEKSDDGSITAKAVLGRTSVYHTVIPLENTSSNTIVSWKAFNSLSSYSGKDNFICIAKRNNRYNVGTSYYNYGCVKYHAPSNNYESSYFESYKITDNDYYDIHIVAQFTGTNPTDYFKLQKMVYGDQTNSSYIPTKYTEFTKEENTLTVNQVAGYETIALQTYEVNLTNSDDVYVNYEMYGYDLYKGGIIITDLSADTNHYGINWNTFYNQLYNNSSKYIYKYECNSYSTFSLSSSNTDVLQGGKWYRIYLFADMQEYSSQVKAFLTISRLDFTSVDSGAQNELVNEDGATYSAIRNEQNSFDIEYNGDETTFRAKKLFKESSSSPTVLNQYSMIVDYTNSDSSREITLGVDAKVMGSALVLITEYEQQYNSYVNTADAGGTNGSNSSEANAEVKTGGTANSYTTTFTIQPHKKYYIVVKTYIQGYVPAEVLEQSGWADSYATLTISGIDISLPEIESVSSIKDMNFYSANHDTSRNALENINNFYSVDSSTEISTAETSVLVPSLNEIPDKIKLLANINLTDTLTIAPTRNIIIDLYGHDLDFSVETTGIDNKGKLEIMDSKATDEKSSTINSNGVTIKNNRNCTLKITSGTVSSRANNYDTIYSEGKTILGEDAIINSEGYRGLTMGASSTLVSGGIIVGSGGTLLYISSGSGVTDISNMTFDTKGEVNNAIYNLSELMTTMDNINVVGTESSSKYIGTGFSNGVSNSSDYKLYLSNSYFNSNTSFSFYSVPVIATNIVAPNSNASAGVDSILDNVSLNQLTSTSTTIKNSTIKKLTGSFNLEVQNNINKIIVDSPSVINGVLNTNDITNSSSLLIDGDVILTYSSETTAITNNRSLTIKGKLTTDSSYSRGIYNNNGTLVLGDSDNEFKKNDIYIDTREVGIENKKGTFYWYDGTLHGLKNKALVTSETEIIPRDNYDAETVYGEDDETISLSNDLKIAEIVVTDDDNNETIVNCTDSSRTCPNIDIAINKLSTVTDTNKKIRLLTKVTTLIQHNVLDDQNIVIDINSNNIKSYNKNAFIGNNGILEINDSSSEKIDLNLNEFVRNAEGATFTLRNIKTEPTKIGDNFIVNNGLININSIYFKYVVYTGYNHHNYDASNCFIKNNNSLNIKNSDITVPKLVNNKNGSSLTINGGNYYKFMNDIGRNFIEIAESSSATIENVKLAISDKEPPSGYYYIGSDLIYNYGTLELKESNISPDTYAYKFDRYLINEGTASVDSTNFYGKGKSGKIINKNNLQISNRSLVEGTVENTGKLVIDNSDVKTYTDNYAVYSHDDGSSVTIKGESTIRNDLVSSDYKPTVLVPEGELILGEDDGEVSTEYPHIIATDTYDNGQVFGISVEDGTNFELYDGLIEAYAEKTIVGVYDKLADGYDLYVSDDKKQAYLVHIPIVRIISGSTGHIDEEYYTIDDAIEDCDSNVECKLDLLTNKTYSKTDHSITIPNNKNIKIIFNNLFITSYSENPQFINNGTLTFGEENDDGEERIGNIKASGGVFVLNNGTFNMDTIDSYQFYDGIILENNGEANIESRYFFAEVSVDDPVFVNNSTGTINYSGIEIDKYAGKVFDNSGTINYMSGKIYFGASPTFNTLKGENVTHLFNNHTNAKLSILSGDINFKKYCNKNNSNISCDSSIIKTEGNNKIDVSDLKITGNLKYSGASDYAYFIGSENTNMTFNNLNINSYFDGDIYSSDDFDNRRTSGTSGEPLKYYVFSNKDNTNIEIINSNFKFRQEYKNKYLFMAGYVIVFDNPESSIITTNNLTIEKPTNAYDVPISNIVLLNNTGEINFNNSSLHGSNSDIVYSWGRYSLEKINDNNIGTLNFDNTSYNGYKIGGYVLLYSSISSVSNGKYNIRNNSKLEQSIETSDTVLVDNSVVSNYINGRDITIINDSTIYGNINGSSSIIIGENDSEVIKDYPYIIGRVSSSDKKWYDGKIKASVAYAESDFTEISPGSIVINENLYSDSYLNYLSNTPFVKINSGSTQKTGESFTSLSEAITYCDDNTECELEFLRNGGKGDTITIDSNKNIKLLGKNYELQTSITNNGNLTMDKVKGKEGIINNATATISNSNIEEISNIGTLSVSATTTKNLNNYEGTLNYSGGSITNMRCKYENISITNNTLITTMYIKSSTLTYDNNSEFKINNLDVSSDAEVNISVSSKSINSISNSGIVNLNDNTSVTTIDNRNILNISSSNPINKLINYEDSTINLNNGSSITGTTLTNYGTINSNNSTISSYTIKNNGTMILDNNISIVTPASFTSSGILTISNGNFNYSSTNSSGIVLNSGTLNLNNATMNSSSQNLTIDQNETDINIDDSTLYNVKILSKSGDISISDSNITTTDSLLNITAGREVEKQNIYGTTYMEPTNPNTVNISNSSISTDTSNPLISSPYYTRTENYKTVQNNYSITVNNSNLTNTGPIIENPTNVTIKGNSVIESTSSQALVGTSVTLTMGENDGNVSTTYPRVNSSNIQDYNVENMNFYDGILYSQIGILNYDYPTVGYRLSNEYYPDKTATSGMKEIYLIEVSEEVETFIIESGGATVDNNSNFEAAVNKCHDIGSCTIQMRNDYVLEKDVTIPEGTTIEMYINGHNFDKNGYHITNNGSFTIMDSEINLIGTLKDLLNIVGGNKVSKNVIIDTYDNGSNLLNEGEFTIQMYDEDEGKYVTIGVNEEIENYGRYTLDTKSSNTTINAINSKVYLNNLVSGNYRLIDQYDNDVTFEVLDDGKLVGNIKENFNTKNGKISIATAEVISSIQTGIFKKPYVLFILVGILGILSLYAIRSKKMLQ